MPMKSHFSFILCVCFHLFDRLFPIRESGMNWDAQELQLHEAKVMHVAEEFPSLYTPFEHFFVEVFVEIHLNFARNSCK